MPALRSGFTAGVVAYLLWGLLPLYWPLLKPASATELLAHRIVWSLLFLVALIAATKGVSRLRAVERRQVRLLAFGSVLVAINWGTFIYGVNSERVVETSLGYFINPLVTVALGVLVLKETLRPAQRTAVLIALAAVIVLTVDYGRPPWLALTLAFSWAAYGLIKKRADVDAIESLSIETAVLFLPALALIATLTASGEGTVTTEGAGHVALLVGSGAMTAVPLLFFGAAAVRIPLVTLGLLQYIAPVMQFLIGVLVYGEPMPASRLAGFALVWIALTVFATDAFRRGRAPVAAMPEPAT
jgi:chloramphenicol-sensitive protein RarD